MRGKGRERVHGSMINHIKGTRNKRERERERETERIA